jgi:hypothetical protein
MFPFSSSDYGPAIAEILALAGDGQRVMPLARGRCASAEARDRLRRLDAAALFAPQRVAAADFAEAARGGLFLYFSCLDEAHSIAQDIASTTGSYWHGIMHRQEPDFSNAAYWFRRVRQHEIFPALREAAGELAPPGAPFRIDASRPWDPFQFIDACEKADRHPDEKLRRLLEEIQRAEWQLLFDFCCRRAAGRE